MHLPRTYYYMELSNEKASQNSNFLPSLNIVRFSVQLS
jgi:hypothetical protein